MIHYHGTPISPRSVLYTLPGRHFCVSFAKTQDLKACLSLGQSLMYDNGAFSAWRRGLVIDWRNYYAWLEPHLHAPHWAVIPDVIDGTEEENDALIREWPFGYIGAPVWHLQESIDRLRTLCDEWPRVCLGSSGEYAKVGTDSWRGRMDTVFNSLRERRGMWLHGLRMMALSGGPYPLASVDSTDIGQNHNRPQNTAIKMASRWDGTQAPLTWQQFKQFELNVYR